ncbi:unnamed protein product, partial [Lactuca virosa]
PTLIKWAYPKYNRPVAITWDWYPGPFFLYNNPSPLGFSFTINSTDHRRQISQLPRVYTLQRKLDLHFRQKMSIGELGCTYASLILCDDNIPVTAEKISTLLKAANVHAESYWPALFAKLAEKQNILDLISNVGAGGGGSGGAAPAVAAPAAGGAAAAAPAAEEKKEEPKEESDDDMGFSLFD